MSHDVQIRCFPFASLYLRIFRDRRNAAGEVKFQEILSQYNYSLRHTFHLVVSFSRHARDEIESDHNTNTFRRCWKGWTLYQDTQLDLSAER